MNSYSEKAKMNRSEQINELAVALSKAQAKIKAAVKDSTNTFFKSQYADLSSIWDACREPLASNGLSVVQLTSGEGENVVVTTILLHESGQFISNEPGHTFIAVRNDPQSIVKCVTYARRCGLAAIVGVAPGDDDDGNAASGKTAGDAKTASGKQVEKATAKQTAKAAEPKKKMYAPLCDILRAAGCTGRADGDAFLRLVTGQPLGACEVMDDAKAEQVCEMIRNAAVERMAARQITNHAALESMYTQANDTAAMRPGEKG